MTAFLGLSLAVNGWWLISSLEAWSSEKADLAPQVVSCEQTGDATSPTVIVRFDRPMVTTDRVGSTLASDRVWVEPATPLEARFNSAHSLVVHFPKGIAKHRDFRLHLSPLIEDLKGAGLKSASAMGYPLHTGNLTLIEDPQPFYAEPNACCLRLKFNAAVRLEDLRRHVVIKTAQSDKVEFTLAKEDAFDPFVEDDLGEGAREKAPSVYVLTLIHSSVSKASITISDAISPASGHRGLSTSVAASLEWPRVLMCQSMSAKRDAETTNVSLYLSHPLAKDQNFLELVKVTPTPKDLRMQLRRHELVVKGDFPCESIVRVTLLPGLKLASGVTLRNEIEAQVTVPQPDPRIGFAGRGSILSSLAKPWIEFKGINVPSVGVRATRVFENNLVPIALGWSDHRSLGEAPKRAVLDMAEHGVEPFKSHVDLGEMFGEHARGVFHVHVQNERSRWMSVSRLFQVTDLGIVARIREEGAIVWVKSLADGQPIEDAAIELRDAKNQLCGKGKTNADGMFILDHLTGVPAVIVAAHEDADSGLRDLAYVHASTHRIRHYSVDVEGAVPREGMHAWVYLDRGVIRPGESVHATVALRRLDGSSSAPGLPATVLLRGPRGQVLQTKRVRTSEHALIEADFALPADQPAGAHRIDVQLGKAGKHIGQAAFRCECVVPDRIEPMMELEDSDLSPGQRLEVVVGAHTLAGDPAPGRRALLRVHFSPVLPTKAMSERRAPIVYGQPRLAPQPFTVEAGETKLDEAGRATLTFVVPELNEAGLNWHAEFQLEVIDTSGRAAFATCTRDVLQQGSRLGLSLRPHTGDEDLVAHVESKGDALSVTATLIVEQIERHGRYVREGRRWKWYSAETASELLRKSFRLTNGKATIPFSLAEEGRIRITILSESAMGASIDGEWWDGLFVRSSGSQRDAYLPLRVIADSPTPGSDVELEIDAPFAGNALLTWEARGVLSARMIDVQRGLHRYDATVPETATGRTGLYATLTLVRGARGAGASSRPLRLVGASHVQLDRRDLALETQLTVPHVVEPDGKVDVHVTTSRPAGVRILLVDEGMLRLTGHPAPHPFGYLTRREALTTEPCDSFTRLVKRMKFDAREDEQGGDALTGGPRLSPTVEKTLDTLVLASKVIACNGNATVSFDLPSYEGRVRVVAIAADERGIGSAQVDVVVRAAISIEMHLPRAVAAGDVFEVPLRVSGKGVSSDLTSHEIDVEGAEITSRAPVLTLRATMAHGKATVRVKATSDVGTQRTVERSFVVRTPAAHQTRLVVTQVEGRSPVCIPGTWLPQGRKINLRVGSDSALGYLPALDQLHDYPFGCVEQTTSRAFPVLAWNDLLSTVSPEGHEPGQAVTGAIQRLASMQTSNGGLSVWPGGRSSYSFGTAYAVEFLLAAQAQDYSVPADFLKRAVDYMHKRLRQGKSTVYEAYVLHQAKRSVRSHMIKLTKRASTLESKAHLIALHVAHGNKDAAQAMMVELDGLHAMDRDSGGELGSATRAQATLARSLIALDSAHPRLPKLVHELRRVVREAQAYTTQENASALRALAAWEVLDTKRQGSTGSVEVDGVRKPFAPGEPVTMSWQGDEEVDAIIHATGPTTAVVRIDGTPTDLIEEKDASGWSITQRIADLTSACHEVRQGNVYRVVLEGTVPDRTSNLLVSFMLPGGLEYEGPGKGQPSKVEGSALAKTLVPANHLAPDRVEPRDDRVLFFRTRPINGTYRHAFLVRAVTRGTFKVVPVRAEALYMPGQSATSSGNPASLSTIRVRGN